MKRMPVLFIGHGSPMNAIEDNQYSRGWEEIASDLPKPLGIIMISAHWFTRGSYVNDNPNPGMIYDMYGFPDALYQVNYPAKGSPELAHGVQHLLGDSVDIDNNWGYDHGNWSVMRHLFPEADIPLIQLSVDATATRDVHYELGKKLGSLRSEGIMLIGSGNIVHNLSKVDIRMQGGFEWAQKFDGVVKSHILSFEHAPLIDYVSLSADSRLSVPTPEHYLPLLYILGAADKEDRISVFNDSCVNGSLSMTSYLFSQ
jgi:4,5-DOPA dioxygenase extradiol